VTAIGIQDVNNLEYAIVKRNFSKRQIYIHMIIQCSAIEFSAYKSLDRYGILKFYVALDSYT